MYVKKRHIYPYMNSAQQKIVVSIWETGVTKKFCMLWFLFRGEETSREGYLNFSILTIWLQSYCCAFSFHSTCFASTSPSQKAGSFSCPGFMGRLLTTTGVRVLNRSTTLILTYQQTFGTDDTQAQRISCTLNFHGMHFVLQTFASQNHVRTTRVQSRNRNTGDSRRSPQPVR